MSVRCFVVKKSLALACCIPLSLHAEESVKLDQVFITGGADQIETQPGSATLIDEVALEQFEYTDIHRILNEVPGVNLQEEDGYGLRPNIGMRGSSPERSKKVTIMEDGVLSGPAPYSAPAAYYFPNVSRMSAVEVFKGPSAIQYGPATVAGALNMVSRPIPYAATGEVDAQLGSFEFQRLNAYYGQQSADIGFLIEGLTVSTKGFKELDTIGGFDGPYDGDTGFERSDVNLKLSYDLNGEYRQRLTLKMGYADEQSNETYVGLTRDDFEADPYRRYAASALDNMQWEHTQLQLTHVFEPSITTQVTTDVYRNTFSRDWFKLNGFEDGTSVEDVLKDPTNSAYVDYYNVLTGAVQSGTSDELRIGNNGRDFISQGIQTRVNSDVFAFGLSHQLEVGVRLHSDEIERNHSEQNYDMTATGLQVAAGSNLEFTTQNKGEATAIAVYVKDDIQVDNVTYSVGLRSETIETKLSSATQVVESNESVLVPGAGVFIQLNDNFGVLGGVHKGYVASAPGQDSSIDPEESINYEVGFRMHGAHKVEVIAFANDYGNIKEFCSFSNGCSADLIDTESNGGEALVMGLEANWKTEYSIRHLKLPLNVTYTYSQTEFENSFTDTNGVFKAKGDDVIVGDELPYVPKHRLNVKAGLQGEKWQVNLSALYQGDMRANAGQGDIPAEDLIEAYLVMDLAANYQLQPELTLYSTIDNLLGDEYLVAAQPMGYRPGKPRAMHLGVKYQF